MHSAVHEEISKMPSNPHNTKPAAKPAALSKPDAARMSEVQASEAAIKHACALDRARIDEANASVEALRGSIDAQLRKALETFIEYAPAGDAAILLSMFQLYPKVALEGHDVGIGIAWAKATQDKMISVPVIEGFDLLQL